VAFIDTPLTSIVIPTSVFILGDNHIIHGGMVFRDCTQLTTVTLLGIWTNEAVTGYAISETLQAFSLPVEQSTDISLFLAITVGTRAIMLQAFPYLTPIALYIMFTTGAPLFVFNDTLRDLLTPLIALRPYEIAYKEEDKLASDEIRNNWGDYTWIL
jgi:hypothetical protein